MTDVHMSYHDDDIGSPVPWGSTWEMMLYDTLSNFIYYVPSDMRHPQYVTVNVQSAATSAIHHDVIYHL